MTSKKLATSIDIGLWSEYGHSADNYIAAVHEIETGDGIEYALSLHVGRMPAFATKTFSNLDELERCMRQLQPDMRRWKLRTAS